MRRDHGKCKMMKKRMLLVCLGLLLLIFFSCSKSNNSSPAFTHWTFKGVTYKDASTGFLSQILVGIDTSGKSIFLYFLARPTKGGDFNVSGLDPKDSMECGILVSNTSDSSSGDRYYSTGQQGDIIHVTIVNGKVNASFSNITVEGFGNSEIESVSGALIEQ
jgi:hypothetical protein